MDLNLFLTVVAGGFVAGWLLLGVYGAALAIATIKHQFRINPPTGILNAILNSMVIGMALVCGPIYLAAVYHDRLPEPKPLPH
jgi:hypothetical protein